MMTKQLLCVNGIQDRNLDVYVRLGGSKKIKLKQFRFIFGRRPSVDPHIQFRKRLWYLRHLKSAGLSQDDLLSMYKCFLLSVMDYALVVYGPMLTQDQVSALERLQSTALKII